MVLSRVEIPPTTPELSDATFVCGAEVDGPCRGDNAMVSLSGEEYRSLAEFGDIPEVLTNAVIAAEDRDFFSHSGINPAAIARAAWTDLRSRGAVQGGSTITQQYVKNAFLTPERSLTRKLREAVISVKLERELGKEEILSRYLNTIYFGRGAFGVQAAAQAYFDKPLSEIGLSEAAYLAALIRSPETTDATQNPEVARRRRRSVLDAMVEMDKITEAEADQADIEWADSGLVPRENSHSLGRVFHGADGSEYFLDAVRLELIDRYGWAEVHGGGLRVYTTLDKDMQDAAYEAVVSTLGRDDHPDAALVAIDDSGRVRAMVGGTDFSESQVNLALGTSGGGSGRQPGSAFKPIVMAEALNSGISMRSLFDSKATETFPGADGGEDWTVTNYGGKAHGVIDMAQALAVSSNVAFAELAIEVGADRIANSAARMGVVTPLAPVASLGLGAAEVSVLDMASAYSTLANRGERVRPYLIRRVEKRIDGEWVVMDDFEPAERHRAMESDVADAVNSALAGVVDRGTGQRAKLAVPSAGKTGTTQDHRDAWFVGFTCKLTAATWVGYAGAPGTEPRTMTNVDGRAVTGGGIPAEIWRKFMDRATVGLEACPFRESNELPGRVLGRDLIVDRPNGGLPFCDSAVKPGTDGGVVDDQNRPCRLRVCPQSPPTSMKLADGRTVPCQPRAQTVPPNPSSSSSVASVAANTQTSRPASTSASTTVPTSQLQRQSTTSTTAASTTAVPPTNRPTSTAQPTSTTVRNTAQPRR